MTTWIVLRLLKWLAIALFTGGLTAAVLPVRPGVRLVGGLGVGTIGLIATWFIGYGMLPLAGRELSEPGVWYTLIASLVALGGGVVGGLVRRRVIPAALVVGGLASSLGLMSAKADPVALWVLGLGLPVALAVVAAGLGAWMGSAPVDPRAGREAVERWFAWIARAEGTSLLVLLFVHMPLKYGAHIEIDGGTGWVGWVHGVLVFLYVLALLVGAVVGRWGILAGVLGFVASLLPFGTFAFEWWLRRRLSRS